MLNAFLICIIVVVISKCFQSARQQPISNNPYSERLTSNYRYLVTGIRSSVETLAEVAYMKNFIPKQVLYEIQLTTQPQHRKANILLLAIQDQIEVNPTSFSKFLDVLRSDKALDHLARRLHNGANMSGHNHLTS